LLFDLGPAPDGDEHSMLAGQRLLEAIDWLDRRPALATLPLGLLGIDTGAAAVLIAAAERPQRIGAVVSCGGRLEPALKTLSKVTAPTLLIVGSADAETLALNRKAQARLAEPGELVAMPRTRHLFEQAAARDRVCELAGQWFTRRLPARVKGTRHA
jgi:putative phosphoribosyl transferase